MSLREDQASITVTVGDRDLGIWTTKSGGETDSEETKIKPGGMLPEISLGGSSSTENVVVTKLEDELVLADNVWLRSQVGRADMVVKVRPLDADGNALSVSETYTGKLKRAKSSDRDANSGDAAMYELELSAAAVVA